MKYLDFVSNNLYLYLAIIIVLLIADVILTIVCLNQRKRKKIKKDFEEIEAINSETDENDKNIGTDNSSNVKPEVAFELEKILEQMQHDMEVKPEEVVRMFEEEQEQKAIISYQELVDSVNNNKIDVIDDEEGEMDYVAALEEQMNPVSSYKEEILDDKKDEKLETYDDFANKSHLDVIDELNYDGSKKRFKSSELLSPVFGRMQPDFEYKVIDSFAPTNNKVEVEQVAGNTVDTDIKKNEDFLNALIEFRNNL